MKIGPVAFLFLVTGGWVLARAMVLWPEAQVGDERAIAWARPLRRELAPPAPTPFVSSEVERRPATPSAASRLRSKRTEWVALPSAMLATSAPAAEPAATSTSSIPLAPATFPFRRSTKRLSVSAWALLRADVSPGLAAAGQLGGSQVGVRARYRVLDGVHLAARLSGPTATDRGKEAALALDLTPFKALPLTVVIERRIGLDAGGRDAFAVGMFGGFDCQLAGRIRSDGYLQAGFVGFRSRDAYVDGVVRLERKILTVDTLRIGAGAGLWGGAQPGASRVDVGPQLVVRAPLGPVNVRLAGEYRLRVAGNARPGSGPVLSLGADF